MIRVLGSWFENASKRLIKTPKIYFRDSGILNALMRLESKIDIERHPRLGALWEGFALEEILKHPKIDPKQAFFWRTHAGAEIDLIMQVKGKRVGVEFKYADAPKITPSLNIVLNDLRLSSIYILYPGTKSYTLTLEIEVSPLSSFLNDLTNL